jgi:hypothetical protein
MIRIHYTHQSACELQDNAQAVILLRMFSNDYTLSKRALGILLVLIGVGGFVAVLLIDVLDAGREGGIGPSQRIALAVLLAIALFGLTLIPLGSRPA